MMPVLNVDALIDERMDAIQRYHQQTGIPRAELDLSGGIDSAVMAGLLVLALGADQLTLVYSSINSGSETQTRARNLAEALGARLVVHDLTSTYESMIADMRKNLVKAGFDGAEISARIASDNTILGSIRSCIRAPLGRGYLRMTGSGLRHGTGNECEDRWLRFYQKGGDGEVDSNPISMLSKGEVFQLACGLGERCAAGLSLYMNRILPTSSFAAPERQASAVDVLVCSSGPGLALERLKLVSELWAAGVRADASHGDDPDLHTQMAQADLLGVPQVAILRKASLLPGGTVVVRTLFGKVRESDSPNIEVERSEVAARIAAKNLPTRSKRAAARKDKEVRSKEAKEEPAPELVAAVRSAGRARAHSSGAANDGRARGGVTSLPVHL